MIRLYHGTSSYWLGHILEHGLGSQNIFEKYDILKFGHHVIKIANQHLTGFEVMTYDLPYLKQMLSQKEGTGFGSWKHGPVFLSCCPFRASRYAHNEWGSEILTRCFRFVRAYSEIDSNLNIFFTDFENLADAYFNIHNPVLLALDLDKSQLLDEAGRDGAFLDRAIGNLELYKSPTMQGGPSFRLKAPVRINTEQIIIPMPVDIDKRRFRFLKVSEITNDISL